MWILGIGICQYLSVLHRYFATSYTCNNCSFERYVQFDNPRHQHYSIYFKLTQPSSSQKNFNSHDRTEHLRLPPRYQLIWTIYIPFESPRVIDFRNARVDLNFWRYVMPCSATCQLVFSGVFQHDNKDTWEKQFGSKYFLA